MKTFCQVKAQSSSKLPQKKIKLYLMICLETLVPFLKMLLDHSMSIQMNIN